MIRLLLFLTVVMAASALLGSCEVTTAKAPLLPEVPEPALEPYLEAFVTDFDRYFADLMDSTRTPGAAVAIVKDSLVIFLKGYGEKAWQSHDPVNTQTLFRIGSLSKGFAGVLTGILVEGDSSNGKIRCGRSNRISDSKEPDQAARLQVRHVLSHTTGLPYHAFDNLIEKGFDQEKIFQQYIPGEKLYGPAGEFFAYQNAAYCLIEPVLQSATGMSYDSLLQQYIFRPAGMAHASLDYETMKQAANKALPHSMEKEDWKVDSVTSRYYGFSAAGGVNASISDMAAWLQVLLGHRPEIVSQTTLDQVFRPVVATGHERRTLPGWIERDSAFYGMGWRILHKDGEPLVYHAGMVNNYFSEIALNRKDGIGICVLFNGASPMRGKCIQAFFERWRKAVATLQVPVAMPPSPVTPPE